MSMFVSSSDRVPVTVDGVNTVYIRPKMPFGVRQKVLSAVTKLSASTSGDLNEADAAFDVGAFQTALMVNNILGWEGPAFQDEAGKVVPCTPANILRLDPDEPLVQKVLDELESRARLTSSPDPNSTTENGSTAAGRPNSEAS